MKEFGATLESFLAGKQEKPVLVRSLQEATYSRDNVVELAYHLLLAEQKLEEKEALGAAHTYLSTRRNEKELTALLGAYAKETQAFESNTNLEDLKQILTDSQQQQEHAKENLVQCKKEFQPYIDAYFDKNQVFKDNIF